MRHSRLSVAFVPSTEYRPLAKRLAVWVQSASRPMRKATADPLLLLHEVDVAVVEHDLHLGVGMARQELRQKRDEMRLCGRRGQS